MNRRKEQQRAEGRSIEKGRSSPLAVSALILACGWLIVPAVQYFATYQRTEVMLEGGAPYPGLATLDLTPLYVVLLATTALFAIARGIIAGRADRT